MKLQPGQRALVTGASRGLGLEIARALAAAGLDIVIAARSPADLEHAADALRADFGRNVTTHTTDLAAPGAPQALAAAVGNIDVLVNNAGVERACAYRDRPADEIARDIAINLTAPMLLAHAILPGMIARGVGHIVNVASVSGLIAMPYQESYSATKAGLVAFSRALRLTSLAEGWGVGVSALCPGFIEGDGMFERLLVDHGISRDGLDIAPLAAVGTSAIRAIEDDVAIVIVGNPEIIKAAAMALIDASAFDAHLLVSPGVRVFQSVARAAAHRPAQWG